MTIQEPAKTDFTIDADMVKHVAFLVRLGIQEDEAQAFSQTSNTHSVMRLDEVRPSMPRQDFMKNVPHQDGAFVQVPLVFGEK
jgi:Asp-tRNA(Asn)/Glu-tRNA(Gln) amidotransferase C subunit